MPRIVKRFRRKTYRKRRFFKRRIPRMSRAGSLMAQRSFQMTRIDGSSSVNQYGAYQFSLQGLPNYTEFTSLFDQYKICAIKIRLIAQVNQIASDTGTVQRNSGIFYHVVDYDDANAPTSPDDLMQYKNLRVQDPTKSFKVYFKPRVAVAVYTGSFGGYGNMRSWIDANSPDVLHYGWKYAWTTTVAADLNYIPVATFYMKFRNLR